jgi:nitrous oxidase accessory protein NosD
MNNIGAIYLSQKVTNIIKSNIIANNTYRIFICDSNHNEIINNTIKDSNNGINISSYSIGNKLQKYCYQNNQQDINHMAIETNGKQTNNSFILIILSLCGILVSIVVICFIKLNR